MTINIDYKPSTFNIDVQLEPCSHLDTELEQSIGMRWGIGLDGSEELIETTNRVLICRVCHEPIESYYLGEFDEDYYQGEC